MLELSRLQIEVAHQVMALIRAGRWHAGDRISDSALAAELRVSRSPVRQVLTLLADHGLIVHTPSKGFQFTRPPRAGERLDDWIPRSETENLYRELMNARAAGKLGEEVSEAELVEQFDATRGAVRRALMRFAMEGLAERLPGHGWRFSESLDNEQAVRESYAFRLIVECGAVLESSYMVRPDQLQALRREQQDILERPLEEVQRDAWFNANARFHETIVSWADNRFLTQSVQRQNSLRRMTEYADFGRLSQERVRQACKDHLDILEAIEEGDRNYAAALLRRHIIGSAEF